MLVVLNPFGLTLWALHLVVTFWGLDALTAHGPLEHPPLPSYPVWPEQFHAQLFQNRSGRLAMVDLYYDWPGGRNMNLIHDQQGRILFDVEYNNRTSFYFTWGATRANDTCKVMHFPVGILTPQWMKGATYLGTASMDGHICHVWTKVNFITYYASVETGNPIAWRFWIDGAWFHVMTFEPGPFRLSEARWQAPPACFKKGGAETGLMDQKADHFMGMARVDLLRGEKRVE